MVMDWNKVATLVEVVHKGAEAGPEYSWFVAQANAELASIKRAFMPPQAGGIIRPAVAPEEE